MKRKLDISGHVVPTNALLVKYVGIVKTSSTVFTIISPIVRLLHDHMTTSGPDVPFSTYSIHDIHEYIKASGFSTDEVFLRSNESTFSSPHAAAVITQYALTMV